jgi:selenocysteine lyase/cysteine desulfurase
MVTTTARSTQHDTEAALRRTFEELRAREFGRLDEGGHVYLDYTGSGLYAECQLRRHDDFLEHHVIGNPHSENPASAAATLIVENTRRDVLDFFHADPEEYTVVFTANASAALKLVGEAYPFEPGSRFTLLQDNHNSVNGIRMYAEAKGASTIYLPIDDELRLDAAAEIPVAGDGPSLFAFPGQSNFSGVKHPIELIERSQALGYDVLFDAAAFVPTNAFDFREVSPDFTCASFYKMFGLPTGVGVLIARREALDLLERPWFAGGTVEYVSVQSRVHRLLTDAESFEDGTPNFLGIAAVSEGLSFLREVGMPRVIERVDGLTGRLLEILRGMYHADGRPAVHVYGPLSTEGRGGAVAFNMLDRQGRVVPYGIVERAASEMGISLRGGCFCNPGAAERALELEAEPALRCFESIPRGSFTLEKFAKCMGPDAAVGALRASVGIPTTDADLNRFEAFLSGFWTRPTVSS